MTCPCKGCKRRTIEPNYHDAKRCEAWAAYCEAQEKAKAAKREAQILNTRSDLRVVKSKNNRGWTYEVGDVRGIRHGESKRRRIPGGTKNAQR